MQTIRTFLDKDGNVVEGTDPSAVQCRELVLDDDNNVVQDNIYYAADESAVS